MKRKRNFLTEKPWWTGDSGFSISTQLIAICLKGRIVKVIILTVLSRKRSIYDQGGCWIWQGEKGGKYQFFLFFITALWCRFEPLMYFTLDTFEALVFETQAAKLWQRGMMGRGKNISQFFSSYCIFWERTYETRGNDIHITWTINLEESFDKI